MIQISHGIQILSGPEAFFDFYKEYDRNFVKLAPKNHIRFQFMTPLPLQAGTRTLSEEVLLGRHQNLKHKIVELSFSKIVLKGLFPLSIIGGKLIFKLDDHSGYFILFEVLEFGFNSRFGRLSDPFQKMYLKNKYNGLSRHSKETLSNIKRIIEDNCSDPDPVCP